MQAQRGCAAAWVQVGGASRATSLLRCLLALPSTVACSTPLPNPAWPGYNRMNAVTVQQTTQGLVRYLERAEPQQLAAGGVAIGYDGRHHSREFAAIAAAVCAAAGVRAWLFSELVPTPFVPAAVQQLVRRALVRRGGPPAARIKHG